MSRLRQRYEVVENGGEPTTYEVVDLVELFSELLDRCTMASHLVDPLFDRGGTLTIRRVG